MADKKSKEKKQEELAKKQGDALINSCNLYMEDLIHTVKKIDDYIITLIVQPAEGKYQMDGSSLDWEKPEAYGSLHLQIVVQDRDDKRFIPNLDLTVRLHDKDSNLITESEAPFMWHPFVFHYGTETSIPDDGEYTVEVTIKTPTFDRHNKNHGKRYLNTVTTKLGPVKLTLPGGDEEDDILNVQ